MSGSRYILATLLWFTLWWSAASHTASGQLAVSLSDSSTISLVTVLPGDAIYSLFGHSAVRVRDPVLGIDSSFNYGTFHFDEPFFVLKFIRGDLDYYLSVARFENALRVYRELEGRPVIEQELSLSRSERSSLFAFLQTNAQPENRYYRYDFLFDNCSTRIRDALETVFGSRVQFPDSASDGATFRQLLDSYLRERSFLRLGIELLLGSRVDRVASDREATFLPDFLSTAFDAAVITDSARVMRPLVASRDTVMWVESYVRPASSSHRAGIALWLLCGLVAVASLREARRGQLSERLDSILFGLVGLTGCFLVLMWFGTAHHVTAANWNLVWAWPTHIVYAALLARKGLSRGKVTYAATSGGAMVVLAGLWGLIPQDLPTPALAIVVMIAMRGTWTVVYARTKRAGEVVLTGPKA